MITRIVLSRAIRCPDRIRIPAHSAIVIERQLLSILVSTNQSIIAIAILDTNKITVMHVRCTCSLW